VDAVGTRVCGHREGAFSPFVPAGLPRHRDALMNLPWASHSTAGRSSDRCRELRARGMRPISMRIALARHACRLAYTLLRTQQP
jgi:transposase